jgi:phage antirepressor YoqD-like protein
MLREREERRKEKNYHEMKQFHRQNLLVYYKKKKKVYDQTFSENDYFQVKKMTCETAGTLNRNSHQ